MFVSLGVESCQWTVLEDGLGTGYKIASNKGLSFDDPSKSAPPSWSGIGSGIGHMTDTYGVHTES